MMSEVYLEKCMRIGFVVIVSTVALVFWNFISVQSKEVNSVELRKILPMDVGYEKMLSADQLNIIREALGLNRLQNNEALSRAAQAHADYLVANNEESHYEVEGHVNFTGVKPVDRALLSKYASRHVIENLSTKNPSAQASIEGLFSAIYHRFGFLSTNIDEVGVGVTQNKNEPSQSAFVYLMGNSHMRSLCHEKSFSGHGKYYYKICQDENHRISEKEYNYAQNAIRKYNPSIVLYPYNGQKEVPPAFYSEIPDPLADYEVSGFPISISFNEYFFKEVKVHSLKLYDKTGQEVENVRYMDKASDPHARFTDTEFALFPLQRLNYATEYQVELVYSSKGKRAKVRWTFKTKVPKDRLYIIQNNEAHFVVKAAQAYTFYFEPMHTSDILKNVQFPSGVDIFFIDNNTIKVVLNDTKGKFDIRFDTKVLHLEVE